MTGVIDLNHLERGLAYEEFKAIVSRQIEEGEKLPEEECDPYHNYMKLNMARMMRLDRDIRLIDDFRTIQARIKKPIVWVLLVEAWCGDVAQNLPVFARIVREVPDISLTLLLRDQNLDVMDHYLTSGGRAIPKLICLQKADFKELGTWGPRPREAQQIMTAYKANPQGAKEEVIKTIQLWYVKDRGVSLQKELLELLSLWGVV